MLRLYRPIELHEIYSLHETIRHLVLDVWASDDPRSCSSKMNDSLRNLCGYSYKKGISFGKEIVRINIKFSEITDPAQIQAIRDAFDQSEIISELCNRTVDPILLDDLDSVVENDIKPLFKWCYEYLLDTAKVAGDKHLYYKELIELNDFKYCPCCGLIDFEDPIPENEVREAYDHYFPKSEYPFFSVNFKNLVPLCYKCNSERKKAKNPIEDTRQAFYPFSSNPNDHSIDISAELELDIDHSSEAVIVNSTIQLEGEGLENKIETWDWLFDIKERYSSKLQRNSKSFLRDLKGRHRNNKRKDPSSTYEGMLQEEKELFQEDIYDDWKFLKIAAIDHLIADDEFLEVYDG